MIGSMSLFNSILQLNQFHAFNNKTEDIGLFLNLRNSIDVHLNLVSAIMTNLVKLQIEEQNDFSSEVKGATFAGHWKKDCPLLLASMWTSASFTGPLHPSLRKSLQLYAWIDWSCCKASDTFPALILFSFTHTVAVWGAFDYQITSVYREEAFLWHLFLIH